MKKYITIGLLLLVTEVAIAHFHFTKFIRNIVGDVLVIPLLYCFIRVFSKASILRSLSIVLSIAFLIELLQLLGVSEILNIDNTFVNIILGSTFDVRDLFAYIIGAILVLIIEKHRTHATL